MDNIDIDLDEATQHAIPEGEYEVCVDKCDVRQAKSGDGEYLNWQFRLVDGEHAGRCVFMKTSLKKEARWRLKELFKALGLSGAGVVSFNPEDVEGKTLLVTLAHHDFNGDVQEEVRKVKAA